MLGPMGTRSLYQLFPLRQIVLRLILQKLKSLSIKDHCWFAFEIFRPESYTHYQRVWKKTTPSHCVSDYHFKQDTSLRCVFISNPQVEGVNNTQLGIVGSGKRVCLGARLRAANKSRPPNLPTIYNPRYITRPVSRLLSSSP